MPWSSGSRARSCLTEPCSFDLRFGAAAGRTFVGTQYVRYPVHVGRGLYTSRADPGRCTVYLQSVSGGLFEHDVVAGRITAGAGTHVHVATPASTVVHSMRGGCATQAIELDAQEGARLEYLPAPQILFPGSHLRTRSTVRLAPGATVVVSETFLPHDPQAAGSAFSLMESAFDVVDERQRPLARERLRIGGADWLGARTGISGEYRVHGSLWMLGKDGCAAPRGGLLEALRGIAGDGVYAGASELPAGLGVVFRVLGIDAVAVSRSMAQALACARPQAAQAA